MPSTFTARSSVDSLILAIRTGSVAWKQTTEAHGWIVNDRGPARHGLRFKVVLLTGSINARQAAAAIALERMASLVGTMMIVGAGAASALIGLP
jgi:hypothetical protein